MTNNIYSFNVCQQTFSIFLSNKYTKWYFDIINNAKTKSYNCYTERHHILPRSLGGSDHPSNLVTLSAREHFICHLLLIFMVEKNTQVYYKLIRASIMMISFGHGQQRYTSKNYEIARRLFSEYQKENQKGKNNSQYNTTWITNFSSKKCIKISKSDLDIYLSLGWVKKRVINFDIYDSNGLKLPKPKPIKIIDKNLVPLTKHKLIAVTRKVLSLPKSTDVNIHHVSELKKIMSHMLYVELLSPKAIAEKYNIKHTNFSMFIKKSLKLTLISNLDRSKLKNKYPKSDSN